MGYYDISDLKGENLKGRVAVLSGGSQGIGEATVRLLHAHGAYVVFGDVILDKGNVLAKELGTNVTFQKTDVSVYQDIYALFQLAMKERGRVDIAISNAGILERGEWFGPSLDIATVETPPDSSVLDINLRGTLWFSRIAIPFLKHNAKAGEDKSLTLMSSVAGFKETPGIGVYQSTKHGVIGLMRSLRLYPLPQLGVRVNTICPWTTKSAMTEAFMDVWGKSKLPLNLAEDVGKIIVAVSADHNLHGESVYIEGGRGWLIEEAIDALEPKWLGEAPSESLRNGQKMFGAGSRWNLKK